MILLALLAQISAQTALAGTGSLDCKAIFRTIDQSNGRTIEKIEPLKEVFNGADTFKYEVDLEGRAFSVLEQKDNSLLGQITQGPEYTKGVVNRGMPDTNGKFNLSDVNGFVVYRLECNKLLTVKPTRLKL